MVFTGHDSENPKNKTRPSDDNIFDERQFRSWSSHSWEWLVIKRINYSSYVALTESFVLRRLTTPDT